MGACQGAKKKERNMDDYAFKNTNAPDDERAWVTFRHQKLKTQGYLSKSQPLQQQM